MLVPDGHTCGHAKKDNNSTLRYQRKYRVGDGSLC